MRMPIVTFWPGKEPSSAREPTSEMRAARKDADPELFKLYTQLDEVSSRFSLFSRSTPDPKDASAWAKQGEGTRRQDGKTGGRVGEA